MKAARVALVSLVAVVAATAVVQADYVEFRGRDYNEGDGDYTWRYRYWRTDTLTANESTWTLNGTVGITVASGALYWADYADLGPNGTWAEWTYEGGDDPQVGTYATFEVRSTAASSLVPYEIDTDGDGSYDYSGYIDGPVPEPGTMALIIVGIVGLGVRLRRRVT